jgi:hypothetical protein
MSGIEFAVYRTGARAAGVRGVKTGRCGAGLRRRPHVAMMQTTDFGDRHDRAESRRLEWPSVKCVPVEREMRAGGSGAAATAGRYRKVTITRGCLHPGQTRANPAETFAADVPEPVSSCKRVGFVQLDELSVNFPG